MRAKLQPSKTVALVVKKHWVVLLLGRAGFSLLFALVLIVAFAVGTVISAIFLKAVEL